MREALLGELRGRRGDIGRVPTTATPVFQKRDAGRAPDLPAASALLALVILRYTGGGSGFGVTRL